MYFKQRLLVLWILFLSLPLLSQMSHYPVSDILDGPHIREGGEQPGPGSTMIFSSPLPGIAVDSAIRYRIVSPGDSVKMTKQVFDLCSSDGKPLRSTIFHWSERGRHWISNAKEDICYTKQGDLSKRQLYEWIDQYEVFSMMECENFNYRKGHLSSYEYEVYDRNMIGRKIRTHLEEYDHRGRLILQHIKIRTSDLGWIDATHMQLEYDDVNGTVSVIIKELVKAVGNAEYKEDYRVLTYDGNTCDQLLRDIDVRSGASGDRQTGEGLDDRIYYFYNVDDLLADQTGP